MSELSSNSSPVSGATMLDLQDQLSQFRQHQPWKSGLFSKLLFKTDDLRLVLMSLEAGARIKEHRADGTISIHCLQGALCVRVQGEAHEVCAGQVLTVPAGLKHDVEAHEESAFLLTMSWPAVTTPRAHQHEG